MPLIFNTSVSSQPIKNKWQNAGRLLLGKPGRLQDLLITKRHNDLVFVNREGLPNWTLADLLYARLINKRF